MKNLFLYIKEHAYKILISCGLIAIFILTFFQAIILNRIYSQKYHKEREFSSPNTYVLKCGEMLHSGEPNFPKHSNDIRLEYEAYGMDYIRIKDIHGKHHFCPTCFTAEQMAQIDALIKTNSLSHKTNQHE